MYSYLVSIIVVVSIVVIQIQLPKIDIHWLDITLEILKFIKLISLGCYKN